MFENTLNQSLDFAFKQAMAKSDSNRQSLHQDLAAFYYNDYEFPIVGTIKTKVQQGFD